jgi:hypothetical protein
MSSTNRSDARDSHIADYYVTPKKPVSDFLIQLQKDEWFDLSSQKHLILDPCAWWNPKYETKDKDGNIVHHKENDMTYPHCLFEQWADYNKIITNDIREDSPAKFHNDFTKTTQENIYDIVITNPPFNIAQDIIENALKVCKNWWYVIMLLRLNYIWSKAREEFWNKNKPYAIYAHNKRMSFTDDWWTDSIEYAHFVFKKWYNPEFAKFKILFS